MLDLLGLYHSFSLIYVTYLPIFFKGFSLVIWQLTGWISMQDIEMANIKRHSCTAKMTLQKEILGIQCNSVLYNGLSSRINDPASWRVPPYLRFSIPNIRRPCGVSNILMIRWDGSIWQDIIANEFSCLKLLALCFESHFFQGHSTISHH